MNDIPVIVFVSPYSHHGAKAGARKRVENLCSEMLKVGVKVICVSPWEPGDPGAKHIRFSLEGNIIKKIFDIIKMNILLFVIRPNLVISESPIAPVSLGLYKVIHVIHDAKFATRHKRSKASVVTILHKLSAIIANKVMTVSNAEKMRLCDVLNLEEKSVFVSYNGISDDWLAPPYTKKEKRFDILYVSNFAKHKGHINLLKALRGLKCCVAFVGSDFGVLEQCQTSAAKWQINAEFFSNLEESELIKVYDSCRLFVFPSELEGFGMPYLEARARGVFVLANDIGVFRELESKIGGRVVSFSNAKHVQKEIKTLLDEGYDRPNLKEFRWEIIAKKILSMDRY